MESNNSSVNLTSHQKLKKNLATLIVACLILWTPILVGLTFKHQTSCHPLLVWSDESKKLLNNCKREGDSGGNVQPAGTGGKPDSGGDVQPAGTGGKPDDGGTSQPIGAGHVTIDPDIGGLIVGTTAGVVVTAFGAPVVVVAGAAVAAWFIIRTILSN